MISKFDFVDSNYNEWTIEINGKYVWLDSFFHSFRYSCDYILKRDISNYWYHNNSLEVVKYIKKILENKVFI
jgi:hypothetical protein